MTCVSFFSGVRTNWILWLFQSWISGLGLNFGSQRAGMRTAIILRSLCTMRAERLTSPPQTGIRANMACCPGWLWKQALTGSTMSLKPTSIALWKQVGRLFVSLYDTNRNNMTQCKVQFSNPSSVCGIQCYHWMKQYTYSIHTRSYFTVLTYNFFLCAPWSVFFFCVQMRQAHPQQTLSNMAYIATQQQGGSPYY